MPPAFNVFAYRDCRALLAAFYNAAKKAQPSFSYRVFSRLAGIRSPSHLKLVIDGNRNLTPTMAEQFATAMKLAPDAREYFLALASLERAKTLDQRERAHQDMLKIVGYRRAHKLDEAHALYHAHWYIPAIRELTSRRDFSADPRWIAQALRPKITIREAKTAIATLTKLKLIERQDDRIVMSEGVVSTGPLTHNVHVPRYHQEMLSRAAESIDLFAAEQRDISTLTFCVKSDGMKRLKKMVQDFRREVIAFAEHEQDNGTLLVHLGLQLFPLSNDADSSDAEPHK